MLEDILRKAAKATKGDWREYNKFKREIAVLWLPREEYEAAIKKLAELLEV